MAMYRPSSSSSSSYPVSPSTNPSSYGYHANNGNLFLPPFFAPSSDLLQEMNDMSDAKEINVHEKGVMFGTKVSRYSPEERKERIERYRGKRNQRNFQKKITYECRKTLADSRPRVKGRFARNDEAESEMESAEGSCDNYNQHSSTGTSGTENAWWQMEAELMADAEAAESNYEEDLWADLVGDFATNI